MRQPADHKIKNAIISVSDKTGIVDFALELHKLGINIYSTGGTKKLLQSAGIPAKSVSELTGFPEIFDGRVKTLHPKVHGGLLADLGNDSHIEQMQENDIQSVDLLVVNLYPFEETLKREGATRAELIENIDIGGPAMIRASAKNYRWTAVVVNPDNYEEVLLELTTNGTLSEDLRIRLAGEAFALTSYYDSLISGYFRKENKVEKPEKITFGFNLAQNLRYGENPHQDAALYGSFNDIFRQLHGKELSYNNIIDIDGASRLLLELDGKPAVAIIKHTNPCGAGTGENLKEAYDKAFATDNVSPFGGIVVMNRKLDFDLAQSIHDIFYEVLIAPEYDERALELLMTKKARRLIQVDFQTLRSALSVDIKSVAAGLLVQSTDLELLADEGFKVVSKRQPTDDEMEGMLFNWRICKHVKSNAIVYGAKDRTLGIGAGQMSRVDSSRIAVEKAKLMGLDLKGSVMASDAFFPFADGVLEAAKAGATAIIQPGGSVRDDEVIAAVDENNMAMIFTGMRHFRH